MGKNRTAKTAASAFAFASTDTLTEESRSEFTTTAAATTTTTTKISQDEVQRFDDFISASFASELRHGCYEPAQAVAGQFGYSMGQLSWLEGYHRRSCSNRGFECASRDRSPWPRRCASHRRYNQRCPLSRN